MGFSWAGCGSGKFFALINGFGRMIHPGFTVSILASLSAAIGKEITFRGFVFGLWAFILNWLFRRFNGRSAALALSVLLPDSAR